MYISIDREHVYKDDIGHPKSKRDMIILAIMSSSGKITREKAENIFLDMANSLIFNASQITMFGDSSGGDLDLSWCLENIRFHDSAVELTK